MHQAKKRALIVTSLLRDALRKFPAQLINTDIKPSVYMSLASNGGNGMSFSACREAKLVDCDDKASFKFDEIVPSEIASCVDSGFKFVSLGLGCDGISFVFL